MPKRHHTGNIARAFGGVLGAPKQRGRNMSGLSDVSVFLRVAYEQPLVEPQVSHFRQVPLRTMVKLPHSEQLSPS